MLRFEPIFARKNCNYYFANLQCLLSSCDFCISNTVRLQLWMKEFLAFELLDDSLKKALPPACPPSGDTKMASHPHPGIVYSLVEGDVPFCKRFYVRYKMLPSRASFLKGSACILILLKYPTPSMKLPNLRQLCVRIYCQSRKSMAIIHVSSSSSLSVW